MSQYSQRKKALNRKRDAMMDLFMDSRIKLANKPTTYGEFYDYVTDLDRPAPKTKRLSARATPQPKPAQPAKATPPTVHQQAKAAPETVKPAEKPQATTAQASTNENKARKSFWDSYTE